MAALHGKYGKDKVAGGSEGYISKALFGGKGPSDEMFTSPGGRSGQTIHTSFALDNVTNIMDIESSIKDKSFGGSEHNLSHSLSGASAVMDPTQGHKAKKGE